MSQELIDAIKRSEFLRANVLLKKGADVHFCDADDRTPLMWAVRSGAPSTFLRTLLAQQASSCQADAYGQTALSEAIARGDLDACACLLEHSPELANEEIKGDKPLHLAVQMGRADIVNVLLKAGADPAMGNSAKGVPLALAAAYGHDEMVKAMLPKVKDARAKWSAFDRAQDYGHTELAKYLYHDEAGLNRSNDNALHKLGPDPLQDGQYKQGELINRLQYLMPDSTNRGGVCHGLSYTGMQAYFANEFDVFEARNKKIIAIPEPIFDRLANEIIKKSFNSHTDKENALQAFNRVYQQDLTMQDVIDIEAFANTVNIYQDVSNEQFEALFDPEDRPTWQDGVDQSLEILTPAKLSEEGRTIKPVVTAGGIYEQKEVTQVLENLAGCLNDQKEPIAIQLAGDGHQLNLNYDPRNQEWLLLEPNRFPANRTKDVSDVVNQIAKAACFTNTRGHINMGLKVYATETAGLDQAYSALKNHLNSNWLRYPRFTAESRARRTNRGAGQRFFLNSQSDKQAFESFSNPSRPLRSALPKLSFVQWLKRKRDNLLLRALLSSRQRHVSRLLSMGADPNACDKEGYSALMIAALRDDLGNVRRLLKHGAELDLLEQKPAHTSFTNHMMRTETPEGMTIYKILLSEQLFKLLKEGTDAQIEWCLAQGADIHYRRADGLTPLAFAETQDRLTAIQQHNSKDKREPDKTAPRKVRDSHEALRDQLTQQFKSQQGPRPDRSADPKQAMRTQHQSAMKSSIDTKLSSSSKKNK